MSEPAFRTRLKRRPLSEIDKRLLEILERDARKPVVALAKAVGLSRTAVQARLDRLQDDGEIAQFTIIRGEANHETKLVAIFLIGTNCRDNFISRLRNRHEVVLVRAVTGLDFDFIVQIEVDKPEDVGNFRTMLGILDDVVRIQTAIVLETCLDRRVAASSPDHLYRAA